MGVAPDFQRQREEYYREIERLNLGPLWAVLGSIFTPEPTTRVEPCLWRWEDVRPQVLRAAELVTAEEAERRVLMLLNPGLKGQPAATQTLYAGLQIILPGEIARSHRHSPVALRFIVEGEGAYTSVDGEQTFMGPGDFVLTPNWTWHDHGNTSDRPMIWLDGLDVPLILHLNQIFYEAYAEERFPLTKPDDASARTYGGGLAPRTSRHEKPFSPIVNYRWDRTYQALQTLAAQGESSPFDDVILEYTNPLSGGPALPTISAFIQLLRPGCRTRAHRHTSSAVYMAVRGRGVTEIDGREFAWNEHDVFVLPTWAKHRHANASGDEEAVLFSFTDEAVLRPLGLYRERAE
jgi:gentisate 1,2-dioxygenase